MNYLKTYESYSSQEILDTISDILLDAKDNGFDTSVDINNSKQNEYRILITNKIDFKHTQFDYNEIKDVMERLLEYLKINGINSYIQIFTDVWHPSYVNTYAKNKIKGVKILFTLP